MAGEPTPPATPGEPPKEGVHQGPVDFGGAQNYGGVFAGNINGYNSIIGTINITVEAATNLTNNSQDFTARIVTASEGLSSIADKIRAAPAILIDEIVDELFAEWEESTDKKGKKKSKRLESESDVGVTRRWMRQVERESERRETMERRRREMDREGETAYDMADAYDIGERIHT